MNIILALRWPAVSPSYKRRERHRSVASLKVLAASFGNGFALFLVHDCAPGIVDTATLSLKSPVPFGQLQLPQTKSASGGIMAAALSRGHRE